MPGCEEASEHLCRAPSPPALPGRRPPHQDPGTGLGVALLVFFSCYHVIILGATVVSLLEEVIKIRSPFAEEKRKAKRRGGGQREGPWWDGTSHVPSRLCMHYSGTQGAMKPDFLFRKIASMAGAGRTGQQLERAQKEVETLERLGFQTHTGLFLPASSVSVGRAVVVSSRASKGFHVEKQLETILSPQEKQIRARVSHLKL